MSCYRATAQRKLPCPEDSTEVAAPTLETLSVNKHLLRHFDGYAVLRSVRRTNPRRCVVTIETLTY